MGDGEPEGPRGELGWLGHSLGREHRRRQGGHWVGLWTRAGAPPRTPQGGDDGLAVDEGPGGWWAWGAAAQCGGSQGRVRCTDQNHPPSILSASCWPRSSAPALRRAPEKRQEAERPHPVAVRDVGNRAAQRPRDTENPGREAWRASQRWGDGHGDMMPPPETGSMATPGPRVGSRKFPTRSLTSGSQKTRGTRCPRMRSLWVTAGHSRSPAEVSALPIHSGPASLPPPVSQFASGGGRGTSGLLLMRGPCAGQGRGRAPAQRMDGVGKQGQNRQVRVRMMNSPPRSLDSVQPAMG